MRNLISNLLLICLPLRLCAFAVQSDCYESTEGAYD